MISIIMIVIGILSFLVGCVGYVGIIISPLLDDWDVVVRRKDDSLFYSTRFGKKVLKQRTSAFAWKCFAFLATGLILIGAGMYFGYGARGSDFWFYKKIFGEELERNRWDKISDKGTYIASDNTEYKNFILVRGNDIYLNGDSEQDKVEIAELDNRLSQIMRENDVALIDSFAVSSTYKQVAEMLTIKGINYIEEEE